MSPSLASGLLMGSCQSWGLGSMLPIFFLKLPSETPSQACEDAEVPHGSISSIPARVGNCG